MLRRCRSTRTAPGGAPGRPGSAGAGTSASPWCRCVFALQKALSWSEMVWACQDVSQGAIRLSTVKKAVACLGCSGGLSRSVNATWWLSGMEYRPGHHRISGPRLALIQDARHVLAPQKTFPCQKQPQSAMKRSGARKRFGTPEWASKRCEDRGRLGRRHH